ncbi:hypothetical protein PFISCL1PPCAC_20201 [Pristionchus fissidentatus]|uniref:BTB domain-containing protein n=1 Tax=Pristionchus fissidentatus TaxID=1538716 RepID=A0AAV5WDV4_9BILA|nr:hypothetical protein PFISCL1PPCAC_20201 [Pristionchus fissidentatus]
MPPKAKKARGEPEVDPNGIRLRVENLSKLKDGVISPNKVIGRYPWAIKIVGDNSELEVKLICQRESRIWKCDASFKWTILNQEDGPNFEFDDDQRVVQYSPQCKSSQGTFVSFRDTSIPKGCFKNDSATIEVCLTSIEDCRNGRLRSVKNLEVDMFSPSDFFDCALIFGSKKIYVSRQFLALHSSFFNTLFFGNFKEARKPEVEIKETDLDAFYEMLTILYKMGGSITESNVEEMLMMADQFGIQCMLNDCESFLLGDNTVPLNISLAFADQYKLTALKDDCLSKIDSIAIIRAMKDSADFDLLSPQTIRFLLDRALFLDEKNSRASRLICSPHCKRFMRT